VDWEAVRAELRPKIERAESMGEAREVITEMIDRLGQSHFGIIPESTYEAMEEDPEVPIGDGVSGIDVRVVEGRALVVAVEPGSGAEEAGVKPGWIIQKVEDKEVGPAIAKIAEAFKDSTLLDLRLSAAIGNRLGGGIGQTRKVQFLDGDEQPREVDIVLKQDPGAPTRFGNLPTFYISFKSRQVDGDIGYFGFNAFFDPAGLMPKIETAVRENLDAPGMILDLRGNPGGIGAMAMGIAGWFVPEGGRKLGTMYMRENKLIFALNRRPEPYRGPLAILVDGCSASTSEILVGGLKDLGRARVFGTRTAGAALPSVVERLPNGDGFQYAFANYISEGGEPLEGKGVVPDEVVGPDRRALLEGRDPVIDAAVRWIREQNAAAPASPTP
jgi:carboxyl-terminal processing protease